MPAFPPDLPPLPSGRAPGAAALRRARIATAALFLLTGFVFATWAARIPARRAELGLSDGQLALAFVGLNAGAVVGLQLGAVVVTRLGSRASLGVSLPVFAGMLVPLASAPDLPSLTVALAVSALANSVVDVAINDQGVGVQQAYGRSLLAGMHAMHSLGGVLGGALAAVAAHLHLSVATHFTITAASVAGLALAVHRALLPPQRLSANHERVRHRTGLLTAWTPRLLVLGTAAFVFTLAEGSAVDWGAVLLHDHRAASPAVAAAGLAIFQAAVTLGRLCGDRAIDRAGPDAVFLVGALLGGLGFSAGLLLGTTATAIAGLAVLGLGLATLLPISISAAGASSNLPVPVAVARVSTLGYLGSFAGPAVIGFVAHRSSLPTALVLPAVVVALAAAAAPATRNPRSARRDITSS
jgi:hypothetical protein